MGFVFGGEMRVRVDLEPVEGGTHQRLLQTGIPDDEEGRLRMHMNRRSCWIFFLVNLMSLLRAGQDLRDDDPKRVSRIEVGFLAPGRLS